MNYKKDKNHKIISEFISDRAKVMDLGCGSGTLMKKLKDRRGAKCQGIERDSEKVSECISKGLNVFNLDFNDCLIHFPDKSFDFVILNNSLQKTEFPKKIIDEALRIGRSVIIAFPNFAYFKARYQLFFRGRTPMTTSLPYEWFGTPNLRFLSIKDFMLFCDKKKIKILNSAFISQNRIIRIFPNLLAKEAIFLLDSGNTH